MASIIDTRTYDPITGPLDEIQTKTGLSDYEAFTTWIKFVVTAFTRNDDKYLDLVKELSTHLHDDTELTRDVLESYGTALGALVTAMEETTVPGTTNPAEILGGLYEHYEMTNDAFGQHFTPQSIAVAKAKMLFPDAESIRDATIDNPITVGDPACGSGRLPFHAVHQLRQLSPQTPVVVEARDIDKTCAHMAVINFALHDIPAYVVHGNSLTYETWNVWRTNRLTRLITNPTMKGIITKLNPEDAPIITKLNHEDGDNQNAPTDQDERTQDDLEAGVTIDSPETTEAVTLDAFRQ